MKTLVLTYPHPSRDHAGDDYCVHQIEQSTEFVPGQFLNKKEVELLCDIPKHWKVVIRHNSQR
jgi:hypothetical protein